MSVKIDITYEGDLRCRAVHGPSGRVVETDAPVDNHGRGESFSPTDLLATSLGACMMTIMGIVAQRNEIELKGTKVEVIKEMVQQPVRRIGALRVTITIPGGSQTRLRNAAQQCPVHQSVHPEIEIPIEWVYA
jgi:putative redox protein